MAMRSPVDDFIKLAKQYPLRKIKSEKDNKTALTFFRKIRSVGEENLSKGEIEFLQVLATLIKDFESKHYSFEKPSPVELLKYLMEEHGLTQNDLAEDFGGQATVSLVLSGKRDFTKAHIEKLSKRFNVSPALFF
ncbi:helix-turn-helix domain-containing protein [bacterium]|nr:helix-turn-helix domain-containing protein [bacterium]QQR57037.1 MAG: helix-turn-helix domain-containing protein [Candidatus Melainabacteria bacterium]